MPGFQRFDQIIEKSTVDQKLQRIWFAKQAGVGNVANRPYPYWLDSGLPAAGATPAAGLAGAVVLTDADAGAMIPLTNAASGKSLHIIGFGFSYLTVGTPTKMTLILVDRIAHANIANDQASGDFSPSITAVSRLASAGSNNRGDTGALIMTEVTTALTTANTRNFTYTNQAGVSGRVTPDWASVASAVVRRPAYANFYFLPLQAGDTGVRSIESTTLVSGAGTGNYNIVLVRPLAILTVVFHVALTERDYIIETPWMPRVYNDSCLSLYGLSDNASTNNVTGYVLLTEGVA